MTGCDNDKLRRDIMCAFPAYPVPMAVRDLGELLSLMAQGTAAIVDVRAWPDLVSILAENSDVVGKLAFLQGDSWGALLPAWMMASLDGGPTETRRSLISAICMHALKRPVDVDMIAVFEARKAALTGEQRQVVLEWAVLTAALPLFDDDPGLSVRFAGEWEPSWPSGSP